MNNMSTHFKDDVIDLTSSFTLADHSALSNIIIELDSDDSFNVPCEVNNDKKKSKDKLRKNSSNPVNKGTSNKVSQCPICWDEFGTNPLAATKCGHVFCIKCLKKTLEVRRQCPTCRLVLKGKSAYHPLYLS